MPNIARNGGILQITKNEYWIAARRPLVSLAFVAPLLAVYEVGVLTIEEHPVRNGADVWLRQLLERTGFGQYFLLPAATVVVLLAWHHLTRQSWRVRPIWLYGMLIESTLLAAALLAIAQVQGSFFEAAAIGPADVQRWATQIVSYCGAGFYEEVLFRLILLPAVAGALKLAGASSRTSLLAAALTTSFLFAAAHHVGPHGDAFDLYVFTFRWSAGAFFSFLFVYRGFGVAVGTHALYDIFAGIF
jgi:hypothetical protein